MGRLAWLALMLGGWLGAVGAAGAAGAAPPSRDGGLDAASRYHLTAEEVEYERDRDVYVARGNVRIEREGRTLRADWVSLSPGTGLGVASGNVVLEDGPDVATADFVQFDVRTLQGVLFQGRVDSPSSQFRLEGREVRKTGARAYAFRDSRFTTCRCPDDGPEPWAIRAEEADIDLDRQATARNTTFEVLGVPVLWVPWMTYPLVSERKTGFLLPEVGASSRRGAEVGVPFFWAVAPAVNLTLTPRWLTRRGFAPWVETEYVMGERSGGRARASFVDDRDIDPDDPSTPFGRSRWGASWEHEQELPAGWRGHVDAAAMSDNLYAFDLNEIPQARRDRFLESVGFVEGGIAPGGRVGLAAAIHTADDLQNPDDLDRDRVLLQRVPDVRLAALPTRLPLPGGLRGALDVRYTNFRSLDRARDEYPTAAVVGDDLFLDTGIDGLPSARERDATGAFGAPDAHGDDGPGGTEGDGLFQEGEPLADQGHRAVVNPRLSWPLWLARGIEVVPEVGYHGTFYETRAQGAESRHLWTARVDVSSRFVRDYTLPGGATATHLVTPGISWVRVSRAGQGSNPLFVPGTALPQERVRELALDAVTRDPADRIPEFDGVVARVDQRLLGGRGPDGARRLLADVTVAGAFHLDRGEPGLAVVDARVHPAESVRTRGLVAYDVEESELTEALVRVAWASPDGHELGVDYRYLRHVPRFFEAFLFDDERFDRFEAGLDRVSQVGVAARAAVTPSWALTYRGAWSLEGSLGLQQQAGVEYISRCRCWAVRVELEDDRAGGLSVALRYRLIGLGDDTVRPFGTLAGRDFLDALAGL